jgi:hypothetical protein
MPLTEKEREHFRARYNKVPVLVSQGELLELSYVTRRKARRFPGKRGQVKGFTPAARLRMLKTLATVRWDDIGQSLFITLTYPDARIGRELHERTRDRYLFVRAMENYLGRKVGALWRLEWKPRLTGTKAGAVAPHVHLIVFSVNFLPWQRVRQWWRGVLSVDGPLATDVRKIRGGKSVAMYVAKYCSKPNDKSLSLDIASYLNTGRAWGVHRRELIPLHERHVNRICTTSQIELLENGASSTFKFFLRGADEGFSLFGPIAKKVLDQLFNTQLDEQLENDYSA